MWLRHLNLIHFKNFKKLEVDFSPKINSFIGENGAGKTNILDAIYYLSFTRSCFNPIDIQNIQHGEDFFAIHGEYVFDNGLENKVHCIQKKGYAKEFSLNEKRYERMADHIGLIPLVMLSPYDNDLIYDGSEARRKYIDGVISQFDHSYLDDLLNYNKALSNRNLLLRQFADSGRFDAEMLEIYNPQLIGPGNRIFEKRRKFIEQFVPIFDKYYNLISAQKEKVSLRYVSQLSEKPMHVLLQENFDHDRLTRYTNGGIHKDDLEFIIEDFPIKRFGSQGQQKSFIVAIKLAQFEFTKEITGIKPILLFDDIFDKLDELRVETIIHLVGSENFGQVFITDTQASRVHNIFVGHPIHHKIYMVSNGELQEVDLI
jgi:DNA replication and repair protein RecF